MTAHPRATSSESYGCIGLTAGLADHDHDLLHELDRSLNQLWRLDQYIQNASAKPGLRAFWLRQKVDAQVRVQELKALIKAEIGGDCF